ncbi:MAG: DUF3015 family protein [Bdellovibrionota bacterium]
MKLVMMFVALFAMVGPAFASDGGGSDGCGLGWQVTQKKSFLATTTRGTTNGVVPPTFGMTSGTIGCDQHSFAKNEMPAVNMVATNQDAIMIDIAAGGGENIAALAQAMGCRDANGLASSAQANYSMLVGSSSEQLYRSVKSMAVANGCAI